MMDSEQLTEITDRMDNLVTEVGKLAAKKIALPPINVEATVVPAPVVNLTVEGNKGRSWQVDDVKRDDKGQIRGFRITCVE